MELSVVRIGVDKRWELEDFGVFSKQYTQCYSLFYSLLTESEESDLYNSRFDLAYERFPWRGGYSVVNFYYGLYANIPPEERPEVQRIQYASPGFIDLTAVTMVAIQLGLLIRIVASSADRINQVYDNIQKGIRERKLGRIEVEARELQLSQQNLRFLNDSIAEFSQALQLSDQMLATLDQRTNGNKLIQLKVLMSLYRRVEPLAQLASEDMLDVAIRENSG